MRKNNLVKIYEEYKNRRLGHIILWEMKKERKCLKWGNKSFVFPATAGLRK